MSKTVLITGSNKGIGFETALQLGKKGFRIIVSGRGENRLDEAWNKLKSSGIQADRLLMDVSDKDSIRNAATQFAKLDIKLDALINNAAILLREDSNLTTNSEEVFEKTIRTNCHGPLEVVKYFLPFMNTPGRIVNISSGGGSMTDPIGGWSPAYCVSKSMLNALTRHLAYELSDKKISVNSVCPGWVRTDMGGSGASRSVQHGAETPVWLVAEADQKLTGKFFRDRKVIPW